MSRSEKLASSIISDTPVASTDAKQSQHSDCSYFTHQRLWWQRVPFTSQKPEPPQKSLDDARIIPEATASLFSLITFSWITPLLGLGYARSLEATDLYKLQSERGAAYIADQITKSFSRRMKIANEYNEKLENGEIKPGLKVLWWTILGNREAKEKKWREETGRKRPSIVLAMNDSIKWWFWSAGLFKIVGDTAQVTSPLLLKDIINFVSESFANHQLGLPVPGIGKGIGLVFALFCLQVISSLCSNQFFYRSMSTGVLLRGGLITAIYSRSTKLSARARLTLTNGKLVNHLSTDVSRIDYCAGVFHMSWTAPIQMILCLILLLLNLGPSALAGFAIFILASPFQTYAMKCMFAVRCKSMLWTDRRSKRLQELLGGMKVIKFLAWEIPFLERISRYRRPEMAYIRSLLFIRSANSAIAMSMPAIASILAYVTYSARGHQLLPASIFSSLTLFNLLRVPLMFLPLSFSAITDAANAAGRLSAVFEADILEKRHKTNEDLPVAIEVKGATFTWDTPDELDRKSQTKKQSRFSSQFRSSNNNAKAEATTISANEKSQVEKARLQAEEEDRVFQVRDISMEIPRGSLVAIVGPVGSGKTSLLQGLVGEMRKTSGSITFGGSVGYCPQSAWIQNATIRENICFGRPFEQERYWKAVRDSCLEPDLQILPNGDMTEVGERGISLSGGQKQRLSICRTIYCDSEIQIFDDPLSALDAHVGKAVFQNVLQQTLSGKTRILVTHALHFLPQVDYIYVVADGRFAEQGTYPDLMSQGGEFSKLIVEFGSSKEEDENDIDVSAKAATEGGTQKMEKMTVVVVDVSLQAEERNKGVISREVYKSYLKAGKGQIILPFLLLSLVLLQSATIFSSYWLVWWQENQFHRSQLFYTGIYAAFGCSQALFSFFLGTTFALISYFASQKLHKDAIERIAHSPMSFFETNPLGRIMSRFANDIDIVDNLLGDSFRMFTSTLSFILGAVILISIVLPWFLIAVFVVSIAYFYAAVFYRASARELKRLDAVLMSSLYSHFSESLSGLATIRAFGEVERFCADNENRVNTENRAYWLTVTNQRWLSIRVEFLSALLIFFVAMLTVGTRFTTSPGKTGLVLSCILNVQQAFEWMIRLTAEVDNNMNSVERIVHYSTEIEQESLREIPDQKPPVWWPEKGQIVLKDVVLKYRPELPAVLDGLTMDVKAGEKVGIVGRTPSAGKSSIMTALYRLVELSSGSVIIDGVDVSKIGLTDLRKALAIIPQDPLLFSGTLRSNLDPFNLHDDATLWDALNRSHLAKSTNSGSGHTPVSLFGLDTIIQDEGSNLSVGQRSLVFLARALVKNAKIIILDEATATVDYETDRKIQDTIAYEFEDRTILCIANRLRTIISYDRICVLDAGQIVEFDTPANLFALSGIFRGMCERSAITLDDIKLAAKANKVQ